MRLERIGDPLREAPCDVVLGQGLPILCSVGGYQVNGVALAAHHVTDLEVSRPTLEEVFLTYYKGGEGTP